MHGEARQGANERDERLISFEAILGRLHFRSTLIEADDRVPAAIVREVATSAEEAVGDLRARPVFQHPDLRVEETAGYCDRVHHWLEERDEIGWCTHRQLAGLGEDVDAIRGSSHRLEYPELFVARGYAMGRERERGHECRRQIECERGAHRVFEFKSGGRLEQLGEGRARLRFKHVRPRSRGSTRFGCRP